MKDTYYKGYWLVTNRCNLRCSYCVLENAPHQLQAELPLNEKKEFITHLYEKLKFRRIALSGGEVSSIGKKPPEDFIELLQHIKQFRSTDPKQNLEIEVYTNGAYLDQVVIDKMCGVVDMVAMTIDSTQTEILRAIGRRSLLKDDYYDHVVTLSKLLEQKNIILKLHSVVTQNNHMYLPSEVREITRAIAEANGKISNWKFYQYMSYDIPQKDQEHAISTRLYDDFRRKTELALSDCKIALHFKDNKEMNDSLFNILSYGNAQYMHKGDTWTTSKRTKDLRLYNSMQEIFDKYSIDQDRFNAFHKIDR